MVASGNKVYRAGGRHQRAVPVRANPGWHALFDQDGKTAEATRRKVYDMLVAEKLMVQGFHYPFPAPRHVEKAGNGYRETTVPWNSAIDLRRSICERVARGRLRAASLLSTVVPSSRTSTERDRAR